MNKPSVKYANTIEYVVQKGLCTGCGTCVGICPRDAVEIVIDQHKGIYAPTIQWDKCNECGLCFQVCPGPSVDFNHLNQEIFGKKPVNILLGNYLNCYIGHATDYEIRYNSASGGIVTALLVFALEEGLINGALVTRMREDRPLEPEPFIARTKEEVISAARSKYCPVPANIALKEIIKAKDGERFAVVGLPCHIHGIRKTEFVNKNLKNKIVLHLGIFCGRAPSFLGTEFLLKRMGLRKDEVKQINYRGEGWPGSMSLELTNNKKVSITLSQYYNDKFTAFSLYRCVLCSDASADLADISFADAWGLSEDKIGKSIIISRNTLGQNVLNRMVLQQNIAIAKINAGEVAHKSVANKKKKGVKARFRIFRLGGKLPAYNQDLPKPNITAYLAAIYLYMRMFLASKRYLWGLLNISVDLFTQLLNMSNRIKSLLRILHTRRNVIG
ncbi:Coenzyme F420 hydrogenase/dehydrogenase, beta subunit C-terminal domain [Chloroflexota bacterium]